MAEHNDSLGAAAAARLFDGPSAHLTITISSLLIIPTVHVNSWGTIQSLWQYGQGASSTPQRPNSLDSMGSTGHGLNCLRCSLFGCRRKGGGCKGFDAGHSLLHQPMTTAEGWKLVTKHVQRIGTDHLAALTKNCPSVRRMHRGDGQSRNRLLTSCKKLWRQRRQNMQSGWSMLLVLGLWNGLPNPSGSRP